MVTRVRIATRKSPLALAQAEEVQLRLKQAWPELEVELLPMTSSGDRMLDRSLAEIGGKSLFTKELDEALLEGNAEIAVHSMKDVQTVLPDGLTLGCMLPREDARDMLVGDDISSIADLPEGIRIGTSSLRRAAQMKILRPDVEIVPFRGNVQTRIDKLRRGVADATLLAVAGLNRLGALDAPGFLLETHECLPAVAQAAIGVECREDDNEILGLLEPLNDAVTTVAVTCERAFLKALGGSCRSPIAGYAELNGAEIRFKGLIANPDGSEHYDIKLRGDAYEAEALGIRAAEEILAKAGDGFMESF
ncbi:MAG: hydroxymethylbilane synthase [Rickettsiales bacterium]